MVPNLMLEKVTWALGLLFSTSVGSPKKIIIIRLSLMSKKLARRSLSFQQIHTLSMFSMFYKKQIFVYHVLYFRSADCVMSFSRKAISESPK